MGGPSPVFPEVCRRHSFGMTDVPVIPSSGPSSYEEPPMPPQQAETPVNSKESKSLLARASVTNLRQSVDEKLLATSDSRIKQVWKIVNGAIGLLIMLNGILRIVGLGGIVYDINVFVMSLWLIIFGLLFLTIELQLPKIEGIFKANIDFMYFPGFRAFFLTFVGTMQWNWWLGIVVSVICFLGEHTLVLSMNFHDVLTGAMSMNWQ